MANVYRIYEGNFDSVESFNGSQSGTYVASMVDTSPVDVNIVVDRESNGDVVVKWVFASEDDRSTFIEFAQAGETDPTIVGVGASSFPGRTFDI